MKVPKSLYKYSKFKSYTINMIKEGYSYFCPANKLDDPFDCALKINIDEIQSAQYITDIIFSLTPEIIQIISRNDVEKLVDNGNLNINEFWSLMTRHNNIDKEKLGIFVNAYQEIEVKLKSNYAKKCINQLFNIRKSIGVCSLSEKKDDEVMWAMYANNYKGYCLEYDTTRLLRTLENNDIGRIIYKDNRNDIIKETIIFCLSQNLKILNFPFTKEEFVKDVKDNLYSKNTNWTFQKEWRIIGYPCEKRVIYPIKAIYLGSKMSKRNRENILNLSKEKDIAVYEQTISYGDCKLVFNKIV